MMQNAPRAATLAAMGERLRDLRHARGMSLSDLAATSGVPPSTISKIENLQLNPSLVHAINLARALDENLGFLVERGDPGDSAFSVMRGGARARIDLPGIALSLEDLQGNFPRGMLESRLGIIGAGVSSGAEPMRHRGEELCHVLSGAIHYDIGSEGFDLGPGDTIQFDCSQDHSWLNLHEGEARVLWVFSERPSF